MLLAAYQDGKNLRYHYALAPMSIRRSKVDYKKRLVWEMEGRGAVGVHCPSYYAGGYTAEPGETLPK